MSWETFRKRKEKAMDEEELDEWSRRKKEAVFSAAEKYAEKFVLDPDELLRTFISWDSCRNPVPPEEVDEYMRERAEGLQEE
ncbi:hypothetical protein AKJ55_00215 [candidate division MSBL1 archaeon SCGC-AAA382M17]|uniref:CopG family transcriptional regulator n=1 Tax=candidate division MSBL1 archaeon SCGC-AAA382M17 TaxID=1698284 RepID=A0ABR5TK29_9EURY|nr:hypothetical protein AKJ55_00215 [candidate division MSBL1 archaeon SCGC-AAA382M17]